MKFSSEVPLQPIAEDEPGPDPAPHPSPGGFSDWLSRDNGALLVCWLTSVCLFFVLICLSLE